MSSQSDRGCWNKMYYPLVDSGAWKMIEYGSDPVVAPEDDGSWSLLSAHEITAEFTAELGRTLSIFKTSVEGIQGRLVSAGLD